MNLSKKIQNAVIKASTQYSEDRKIAYKKALKLEREFGNEDAAWALEQMISNFELANSNKLPLCDDTGIPHVLLEFGSDSKVSSNLFDEIAIGIENGLNMLPARPMAVQGNEIQRIEQSEGLYDEPGMMKPCSFLIEKDDGSSYSKFLKLDDDKIRIHILLEGGGPEIRAKTYRIFHKRSFYNVIDESISWLKDSLAMLGCTPSIPSIGIGRSHFEANSLMLRAMVHGNLEIQSDVENYVSSELNKTGIGPLSFGGKTTVLGSFVNIGCQRASGVRIVSVRPACFVEPRVATVEF